MKSGRLVGRLLLLMMLVSFAFLLLVLLASSELKSCLSFTTPSTDTNGCFFGHIFLSSSDKIGEIKLKILIT